MTAKHTIYFILTGGTIDSYYEGIKDTAVPNKHSVIPRFIRGLRLPNKAVFNEICMKDSRSLNKKDLLNILKVVVKAPPQSKIIVTHGTYTMADTARFVKANLKQKNKTIIFTGSFIPLDGFTFSDAPFNLGFAIAKAEELPAGVYVCMNGRVFSSDEAIKIISQGAFESIFGENK